MVCKGAGFDLVRNPLRREYGRGDLHFITFSCHRRRPYLGSAAARDTFVRILNDLRDAYRFALVGYVVMPEHVHLLISEPERGTPSIVIQVLKQKVSCALRGEREKKTLWQRRFYDFNVWSSKKVPEKLRYMHENPVKRKLVSDPGDWKWSSWSRYANGEPGVVRIDGVRQKVGSLGWL